MAIGNENDNTNAGQPMREEQSTPPFAPSNLWSNNPIGRIRRPPPLTVELVLSQLEGLGESEHNMPSQVGELESRIISESLEHRANGHFHQTTNMLDWEAILLGGSPRPHECLQMFGEACSQGELLPSASDLAFLEADSLFADTDHALAEDVLASADGSRYPHTNALCCAVDKGLTDMIQCLLHAGADPMTRDQKGRTALHYAARRSNAAILNRLLGLEVNIDVRDSQGRTPLFNAVEGGNIESARLLLQLGANVYVKDDLGVTVLCLAVHSGFLGLVEVLLEFGADVNG
ncbi:hypothetical protein G3M48_000643 [Beauveria asiatica]|uniref:Ankyrin repeat protein n=1 Tax=Beauveria asiatica TaxID=1069075 RepID=A0AAW0S110_9HYPO